MKRPPSLSEGCISFDDYKVLNDGVEPRFMTLSINTPRITEDEDYVSALTEVSANVESNKIPQTVIDYLLRFFLHLTLISLFETIFFFRYVSVDEDTGITQVTNFYTDKIIRSCADFTQDESAFLNKILDKFVNASAVENDGIVAYNNRMSLNGMLYKKSWGYFGGICGAFLLVALFGLYKKYNIRWRYIIFENCAFVSMLGVYEYLFFQNIIKKYATETPAEISRSFVSGLQNTCGLLK